MTAEPSSGIPTQTAPLSGEEPSPPVKLETVLKEEIKKINQVDLDAIYADWMILLTEPKDIYFFDDDHIVDPKGFLLGLKKREPGSFFEILFQKLSKKTGEDISTFEDDSSMLMPTVIEELNVLLAQGQQLMPVKLVDELGLKAETLRLVKADDHKLKTIMGNRLLLEAAFPEYLVKVSDTLPGIYAWLHAHPRTALCFSGGGIRSATFGLGILQGLARHDLIGEFDYLSTVSGGGYLGGWLSAWMYRAGSPETVFEALKSFRDKTPLKPEPEQVRHLREYSNYLTPRLGLLSADTWTLIGTYLRNLFLNWVIFMPALATLLLLPRGAVALLRQRMEFSHLCAIALLGLVTGAWAIVYAALHRPSVWREPPCVGKKPPTVGTQKKFLLYCFAPLWISATCFTSLWAWAQNTNDTVSMMRFTGLAPDKLPPWFVFLFAGAAFHILAWVIYCWRLPKNRIVELLGVASTGAFGGLLFWLGAKWSITNLDMAPHLEWYVCLAVPYFLIAFLITASLFIGLTSRLTTDDDREWWARMGAWLLIGIVGWSGFSILVLFGPQFLCDVPRFFASVGGISTIVTLYFGYSERTPAGKKPDRDAAPSISVSNICLAVAAPLFIACLISTISLCTALVFKHMESNPAFAGAAIFRTDDITDLPALAASLTDRNNQASQRIWFNLSEVSQRKLAVDVGTNAENKSLRLSLVNDFNKLLANSFYNSGVFSEVKFSPDTESLLYIYPNLRGQRLARFNRLLLQDIFPEALAKSEFDHLMTTHWTQLRHVSIVFVISFAIAWLLSRFININRFSLGAVYKNRIVRAYLGASNPDRHPNPFSGFDPADNIAMSQLSPRPLHIVNMALNLVTGDNLAWQQRKAESFTASPLFAGNYRLGYRDVQKYASHQSLVGFLGEAKEGGYDTEFFKNARTSDGKNQHGLNLGTAITISGAAASPNSGYHSSPIIAVLMTLFNVRLGAWLGNPGKAGNKTFTHRAPRSAAWHVVKEALGLTDDSAKYVYLSDGGHFENLGLYEMVLRRCHFIVVSDAGCDPDCALEDLGNAIRKIRIDLGIPIEINEFNIASRVKKNESKYCAIGTIDYSHVDGPEVEPGILIYIKPALAGTEPRDVFNYKETSVLFPHEPTSDQWFSESQFESYRMLGLHIVQTMCNGADGVWQIRPPTKPLDYFKAQASEYVNKKPPSTDQTKLT